MWVLHPSFHSEVKKIWLLPARNIGLTIIKEKLLRLKQFLRWWNKHVFGNILQKIKILEKEVEVVEVCALQTPSLANCNRLKEKQAAFAVCLDQEEAFWRQKASAT